ncbi:MAG: NAD-dependent epimerase/dehydratase family protein [Bacteroidetes bacterium]|jgi:nucleoside-diphosphate-sugar epimerase|nr:NAD-dependent epimerase/dehydratase family protein [Bacteroidota bacterium]
MRILFIGGTQFMGRATVERMVARGHDVSVLHRRDYNDFEDGTVQNIQADRGDLDAMARILGSGRFDAVFDFAYDMEHGTTPAQIEAAARSCGSELERYVFISSVVVYGGGVDLPEDAPLVPNHPIPYYQHKAASEQALFAMHRASGVPVTTLRPPFVHGPRQPYYREAFFWDRMLDDRPVILPDGGTAPMQWVFAPDVAEACVRILEVPEAAGEAFNVGHKPTTQRGFVEALARAAGVEPTLVSIPRATIHAGGGQLEGENLYFGEFLDVLPPLTSAVEKAARVLDLEPTPLDEALRESFAWYREQSRRPVDYSFEDRLLAAA